MSVYGRTHEIVISGRDVSKIDQLPDAFQRLGNGHIVPFKLGEIVRVRIERAYIRSNRYMVNCGWILYDLFNVGSRYHVRVFQWPWKFPQSLESVLRRVLFSINSWQGKEKRVLHK